MSPVYGPEVTITHKWREIYKSRFIHSDLVLLCSDNDQVFVHQAIMANLSPLMKEVLMDHNIFGRSDCAFIFLDQDSDSVRKMVEVLYSGKAFFNYHEDMEMIKGLLNCLGIDICLESSASSTNGWIADFMFDNEHVRTADETPSIADDNGIAILSQVLKGVPPIGLVENNVKQKLATTTQTRTRQFDNVLKSCSRFDKRKREDSGTIGKNNNKVSKLLKENSQFLCPVCSESFKLKGKLIKHQVDEHYYEDLENLLVEEFIESKVCCKVNFTNTGFGMFIRHKVAKHGALELVSFKSKHVCTFNDKENDHVVDVDVSDNQATSEKVQTKNYLSVKPFASRLLPFKNVVSSFHALRTSDVK